jgi:predicted alpha/beta hydrolase family esterase
MVPQFQVPKVPTPGGHKLNLWLKEFKNYKESLNKDAIIIAHSRGCTFTLHLLPEFGIKIDSLFLVGAPVDYDQWRPDVYSEYDPFQAKPYLWKRIRQLVKHIEVFQSTNDDIPVSEGLFIADKLKATINIVKNAGHFNTYTYKKFVKFPLLLKKIKDQIKNF